MVVSLQNHTKAGEKDAARPVPESHSVLSREPSFQEQAAHISNKEIKMPGTCPWQGKEAQTLKTGLFLPTTARWKSTHRTQTSTSRKQREIPQWLE